MLLTSVQVAWAGVAGRSEAIDFGGWNFTQRPPTPAEFRSTPKPDVIKDLQGLKAKGWDTLPKILSHANPRAGKDLIADRSHSKPVFAQAVPASANHGQDVGDIGPKETANQKTHEMGDVNIREGHGGGRDLVLAFLIGVVFAWVDRLAGAACFISERIVELFLGPTIERASEKWEAWKESRRKS